MNIQWQELAREDFCYLTTVGRRSGHTHTIEIWFVLNKHTLYMLSGSGDSADWVRNIQQQADVMVKIKGMTFTGQGRIVSDERESLFVRQLIAEKYPSSEAQDLSSWYTTSLPIAVDITG